MHEFIQEMILRNSVNAALQTRGGLGVFSKSANNQIKRDFKIKAKEWLVQFGNSYIRAKISKITWCNKIQFLANLLTNEFKNDLIGKHLRIGISQKMISLYLKYLWLLGNEDKKPLFAVLDQKILNLARIKNNWTELDSIEEYARIILKIDKFAKSQKSKTGENYFDGAEWEADKWKDKADKDDSPAE
jgi:hypothetical protein